MAVVTTKGVLLGLLAAVLWVGAAVQAEEEGDFVSPSSKAATVENCVEPTEYMRRNHFELIRHQQDRAVYGGIRGTKHSIGGCVDCHVSYDAEGKPVEINGKGQFCNSCHEYAAVDMNCFDCHATVPEGESWNHEVAAAHAHLDGPESATAQSAAAHSSGH